MWIKFLRIITILTFIAMVMYSCEDTKDDGDKEVPVPTITSIEPFAGYPGEEVTITGENFNAVYSMNLIQLKDDAVFHLETVTPNSGTETMLTFTRPNISGVGVTIHAWLQVRNLADSEEKVSDSVAIDMLPVFDIISVAGLPKTKGGIAFDDAGNMYVRGQDPGEIYKITPDGTESYFGETHWGEGEMVFDATGNLYAAVVWGDYGIWKIPPTGGTGELYLADADAPQPFCLDFDANGNFYVGSAGGAIYRESASTGEITTLIDGLGWGTPMRLFGDDIYWYTKNDSGSNGLYKAPIPADGDTIATSSITQILFSDDYNPSGLAVDGLGDVYLMDGWIDKSDKTLPGMLVRVTPAGVVEDVFELPTQNPNKAAWFDNKIHVTAGDLDSTVYIIHLGEERGTGAVP
ncbi:MAG: IPT/TIG domain-containing protein [Candidatus Marinimicrobia bacterium]|nr:IPT/TIG domain-containing protein [Candidatus Neomarinimicrobiota bacterium]